ncbi:HAD family hydrolase [Agrococcus carbonis]|uniref:Cof subfamily of IIB subfamily of haloacid dehalogenase superfamily/HAD-superfamily hydrolase, subfamily IIB n=1 Tax=Agrococcus carbonis TaxID=684552 RepID=A0A1H1MZG7_9MICO|nr:HAD hydrolase family protein [Agrococcus carbonis]SDR91815.1 Cof subfamily of IIB subfamily of haloacid dehalogenase superfamily/HAD-superfamily hydrolase, subfamily IIB [Agrococcus carbonis]
MIRRADRLLIALDIDGTVVREDDSMSQRVADAVRSVAEAGHDVVLATGRSKATTVSTAQRLGIEPSHLVSANGALVLERRSADHYATIHVETFDPAPALRTIAQGLPTGSFMVEDATGHRRYTDGMIDWNLDEAEEVAFEELLEIPAMRVVVMSPDHQVDEFLEIVESMGLHKVSYAIGYSSWLDIAPDGVNKATGLQRVADLLGYSRDRILVVGDGRNDIDMFQWAVAGQGRAVAMGQAPDEVKAAASEVTASVEQDGLAIVLEGLLVSA